MRHAAADAAASLFGRLKPSGKQAMEDYEHFIDLVHDIRLFMPTGAAIVAFNEAKRGR